MKSFLSACGLSFLLFTGSANAALTLVAHYQLGEAGSLGTNNRPLDSSGNGHHFQSANGTIPTVSTSAAAPGSTRSLTDSGVSGFYNAAVAGTITDNFAMDIWVKTTATTQSADIFEGNATNNGSAKFSITGGNWTGSYHNIAGYGGVPVVSDVWAQLSLIRYAGSTTFYVNGTQIGGASSAVPTNPALNFSAFHLSVNSGGSVGFTGNYDELRLFTFNPAVDSLQAVRNVVFIIPEPATASLGLLSVAGLMLRRRRVA